MAGHFEVPREPLGLGSRFLDSLPLPETVQVVTHTSKNSSQGKAWDNKLWRFLFGCGNRVRRMQVCLKNSPHRGRADCSFHGCREAAPKLQELQISAPDENGQETMGRGRPKQSRKR